MNRLRAVLLLIVVFLAGAASGTVGTAAWVRHHRAGAGGPRSGRIEQVIVRRIARRLDLDASQREILQRVAADTRGRMDEVRLRAVERVHDILDEAFDELEPTLRPDQREKLGRMRQEARSRLRHRGGRG